MHYKFGQKNHWRRTMWNKIVERLEVPTRDAIVVYLGGRNDLDRDVALSKGFRHENLIFVDKSKDVVVDQRKKGTIAIAGDFAETIYSLPPSLRVHVVFGDFCRGLSPEFFDLLYKSQWAPRLANSVFAFNFLRGRDPQWNQWRRWFSDGEPIADYDATHRGVQFWSLFSVLMSTLLIPGLELRLDGVQYVGSDPLTSDELQQRIYEWMEKLNVVLSPTFLSYRSTSRQTFDSLVYRGIGCSMSPDVHAIWARNLQEEYGTQSTMRSLAAIAAHRTMRRKRVGPYARSGT